MWSAAPCATCCWAASRTSSTSWSRATRSRCARPPARRPSHGARALRYGHGRGAGATFDLAGARRESYEQPGALPDVELGASLRDDLERRDFTVNAIALHLVDGELIWFPRAERTCAPRAAGPARPLVPRRPDAPAAARALRRAARVRGRRPHRRLAAEAIKGGALDTVSGPRLGAELRLLLREPQPEALPPSSATASARHCWGGFAVHPDRVSRDRR